MKHPESGRKIITLILTTSLWFSHAAAQTESEPGQQVFQGHPSSCHVSAVEVSATQVAPSFAQKPEATAYLAREMMIPGCNRRSGLLERSCSRWMIRLVLPDSALIT